MTNCNLCTRDELEDVIDEYIEIADDYIYEDLVTFVADKLNISEEECMECFGEILANVLDYDEDKYINSVDKVFKESEIKSDFKKFLKEQVNYNLIDDLLKDRILKTLRKTNHYYEADKDTKFKILWKYVVREYGAKLRDQEELAAACEQIASDDENKF